MFCRKCGAAMGEGDVFCAVCGERITMPDVTEVKKKKRIGLWLIPAALILMTALILGIVFASRAGKAAKIAEQLSIAERYLDELDYDKAVAAFKELLEIDPLNEDAYLGLAEAYIALQEDDKAERILKKGYDKTDSREIKKELERLEEHIRKQEAESLSAAVTPTSTPVPTPTPEPVPYVPQVIIPDDGRPAKGDPFDAVAAYARYAESNFGEDYKVYCIYLNNDSIPEAVYDFGDAASGAVILTYDGGNVDSYYLNRGEFSYEEVTNTLFVDSYHSDWEVFEAVKIVSGKFNGFAKGSCGLADNSSIGKPDLYENDAYWTAEWDGNEVSRKDFTSAVESLKTGHTLTYNMAYTYGIEPDYGHEAAVNNAYYDLRYRWGEEIGGKEKPNLYLYPEIGGQPVKEINGKETVELRVSLRMENDRMAASWPVAEEAEGTYRWNVYAAEDGTLYDAGGNEYSYIFWDTMRDGEADFSEGFCVRGCDTAEFLRETLSGMGLTPREYNEFIVYWLPRMKDNPYNIISFQNDSYAADYPLEIEDPAGNTPDSVLRVMMAWKPSREKAELRAQSFEPFERKGFVVVEWGGYEIDERD